MPWLRRDLVVFVFGFSAENIFRSKFVAFCFREFSGVVFLASNAFALHIIQRKFSRRKQFTKKEHTGVTVNLFSHIVTDIVVLPAPTSFFMRFPWNWRFSHFPWLQRYIRTSERLRNDETRCWTLLASIRLSIGEFAQRTKDTVTANEFKCEMVSATANDSILFVLDTHTRGNVAVRKPTILECASPSDTERMGEDVADDARHSRLAIRWRKTPISTQSNTDKSDIILPLLSLCVL